MQLDYIEKTQLFTLRVPRREIVPGHQLDPQVLMREYGLDLSGPASTPQEALLYTRQPYAAASFAEFATDAARGQLGPLLTEIEASWAPESKAHIATPADKELWPFQRAGVEYALRRRHTLIGDQPGLGKTEIAIGYANEIKAKRVLVVCPASIRLQWAARIREWSTLPWPYIVHVIHGAKSGVHPNAAYQIVSYDLLRAPSIAKLLVQQQWDVLILDEAHYVKTIDSLRTRALFGGGRDRDIPPIAESCGSILALTGTPLPNRPRECYSLARAMCWDAIDFLSEDAFGERFNPSQRIQRIDPITGRVKVYTDERSGRHAELQNRLRANFMVRHLKRDVMPQLQLPIYDIVQAQETGAIKQALKAESLLDIDPETFQGADGLIDGQVATVRRMMGEALAPQVADYVEMLVDGGEEKIVVFAWHKSVVRLLYSRLDKLGCVVVDGDTSSAGKVAAVNQFRTNPRVQVIIGNVLSLGTGTDGLQHVSNHAVIAEPDWVPGNNVQCFDRLDRGGQTRQVQGDIFVAPGSFAERVLASALRKMQTVHNTLDRRVVA